MFLSPNAFTTTLCCGPTVRLRLGLPTGPWCLLKEHDLPTDLRQAPSPCLKRAHGLTGRGRGGCLGPAQQPDSVTTFRHPVQLNVLPQDGPRLPTKHSLCKEERRTGGEINLKGCYTLYLMAGLLDRADVLLLTELIIQFII